MKNTTIANTTAVYLQDYPSEEWDKDIKEELDKQNLFTTDVYDLEKKSKNRVSEFILNALFPKN